MKRFNYRKFAVFIGLLMLLLVSCEKEEEYPKYDVPVWQVGPGNYSVNMTAIFELPSFIQPYTTEGDKMAAFVDGTCRGVANIIDGHFYILIKGYAEEQAEVSIRYYNARNRYLYEAVDYTSFEPDLMIGTPDNPEVLPLKVKE